MVISNIDAILKHKEEVLSALFKEIVSQFIAALFAHKDLLTWANIYQVQFNEILQIQEKPSSTVPDPKCRDRDGESLSASVPTTSNSANETPKSASGNILHIKKFSPLIQERSKLRCTVAGCSSRFAHRRSYQKHMRVFHQNHKIDLGLKDPPGTCLMLSAKTNRTCGAKLPYRSIYQHLQTFHNIKRPADKILFGFDLTTSIPKPVFVSKGEELEPRDEEQDLPLASDESSQELDEDGDLQSGNGKTSPPRADEPEGIVDISQKKDLDQTEFTKDIPIEIDDDIPNEILNLPADQTLQLIEALEDTIPSNIDGSYILQRETISEDTNDSVTSVEHLSSTPIAGDVHHPSTQRGEKRKHSNILENMFPDLEDEILLSDICTPPIEATYGDTDVVLEPEEKKEKVSSIPLHENMDNDALYEPGSSDVSGDEVSDGDSNMTVDERVFSDYEDDDDSSYTETRRKNKSIRHLKRNTIIVALKDREQNSQFIADFISFMKDNIICTRSTNPTTLTKALRHLFHQEDSLLSYESERDNNFHLEDYRDITSPTFRHLPSPADWVVSTSGREGNKGLDRLKSHAELRKFLEYEVAKYTDPKYDALKKSVRENLMDLDKQVTGNRLFKKYTQLSKQKKQLRDKAMMILEPSRNVHVENIVRVWNKGRLKKT